MWEYTHNKNMGSRSRQSQNENTGKYISRLCSGFVPNLSQTGSFKGKPNLLVEVSPEAPNARSVTSTGRTYIKVRLRYRFPNSGITLPPGS